MKYIYIYLFILFSLGSINLQAQDSKAKPRDGEGTHTFLKRHKRTNKGDYDKFLELNKGKFGRNNSLLKGVTYTLPPLSGNSPATAPSDKTSSTQAKKTYKLFGTKYQDYTVKSNKLKGAVFFLSSGHGGPDPGAVGKIDGKEVHEDEYAYDITLRLIRS